MTLQEIYNQLKMQGHESDKGTVHSYIPVYEEILAPYRSGRKNILEIGLLSGASLRMWEQYFSGTVYGIDCDLKPIGGRYDLQPMIGEKTFIGFCPRCGDENKLEITGLNELTPYDEESYECNRCDGYMFVKEKPAHNIIIGDAESKEVIEKHFSGIKFDVIIEDANHSAEQQIKLYENFKPYLSNNGIYIIEDIQDVDATKEKFINIDNEKNVQVIDLRNNKGRYDDVLVVIK